MTSRKDLYHLHRIWTRLFELSQELYEMANTWRSHQPELDELQKRLVGYYATLEQPGCALLHSETKNHSKNERT